MFICEGRRHAGRDGRGDRSVSVRLELGALWLRGFIRVLYQPRDDWIYLMTGCIIVVVSEFSSPPPPDAPSSLMSAGRRPVRGHGLVASLTADWRRGTFLSLG